MRVFESAYEVPETISVNVVSDVPGFKKLQYVNAQTQCTGVWLFNTLDTRAAHERYVNETIDKPMARSLTPRIANGAGTHEEELIPVHRQDARAIQYVFIDKGTTYESGYVELYDDILRLSVVLLSDCMGGDQLEADQRAAAEVLKSQRPFLAR